MAIVFKCLAYFIFHHAIGNCLQKACSGMLTVWMFNRYVVHCLARCATGSIHLALSISGAQAAKWVYRERCDLAGAALQVLPVPVFVCRCCCLLCWCSCSVADTQNCGGALWHFDESMVTALHSGRTATPPRGRRQEETKKEREKEAGLRANGWWGRQTQSRLNLWTYEKIDLEDVMRGIIEAKVKWGPNCREIKNSRMNVCQKEQVRATREGTPANGGSRGGWMSGTEEEHYIRWDIFYLFCWGHRQPVWHSQQDSA